MKMRSAMIAKPFLLASVFAMALIMSPGAHAGDPPFPNKQITLSPNQQPVGDMVKDLFTQAGMSVKISTQLPDRIAGRFTGTPAQIWNQVARVHNLVAYYDGSVVRVYPASEISTVNITAANPDAVVAQARRMGMMGAGNSVKAGSGIVIVSGVPAFREGISGLAARSVPAVKAVEPIVTATAPAVPTKAIGTGDIVSPIGRGPATTTAQSSQPPIAPQARPAVPSYLLDSMIMQRASRTSPMEIRIYNLKHADASDREINMGDRNIVLPGVATILRQQLGDGLASGTNYTDTYEPGVSRSGESHTSGYGGSYPPYGYPQPYGPPPGYGPQPGPAPAPQAQDPTAPRITADPARNSVIVRDLPSRMDMYDQFIRSLDRPRPQIEIQATIIDVDINRLKTRGIEVDFGLSGLGGLFRGTAVNGQNTQPQGNFITSFVRSPTQFVSATIDLLDRQGSMKVVSRPSIVTKEGEPGVADFRQLVPVRFSGQYNGGINNYRVGLFLSILPRVAKDVNGLATTMQIDLRNGRILQFSGDGIPIQDNNGFTTNVTIPQGESLIIGGLTVDTEFESSSKIPVFGDIPVIGAIGSKRRKGGSRVERIVIITPRIISDAPNQLTTSYATPYSQNAPQNDTEEEVEELRSRKAKSKKKRTNS